MKKENTLVSDFDISPQWEQKGTKRKSLMWMFLLLINIKEKSNTK